MSLRDQLLKAGLVNKKQVKRTEAAKRQQKHREHKGKQDATEAKKEREEELAAIQKEKIEKREQDLLLNREIEARRKAHEDQFRCRQLVRSQSLNEQRAELAYFFRRGERKIGRVYVTPMQQELLARGRAALVEDPDEAEVFLIVGEKAAKTLAELCPEWIVCQHPELSHEVELGDD